MALRDSVLEGLGWTGARSLGVNILRILFSVILARILGPSIFGLMAMVILVRNFVALVRDAGLSSAIVVYDGLDNRDVSSLFWLNLLFNFLLYIIVFFIAPFVSLWFDKPIVTSLIRVSILGFLIDSSSAANFGLLRKELKYKEIFFVSFLSQCLYGVVAILMAVCGYGVWSLVLADLFMRFFTSVYYWFIRPIKLHLIVDIKKLIHIVKFSLHIMGGNVLNYVKGNIDTFFIGRFMGDIVLGYYSFSFRIIVRPITEIGIILYDTFLPIFARLSNVESKKHYLKLLEVLSVFSIPVFWMIMLTSPYFVPLLFGINWEPAIPFFVVRSAVGAFYMLMSTFRSIFYTYKKPQYLNYAYLAVIPFYAISFFIGSNAGVNGVLIAILLSSFFDVVINFIALGWLLIITLSDYIRLFLRGVIYGLVMVIIGFLLKLVFPFTPIVFIIIYLLFFIFMFALFFIFLDRSFWDDLIGILKRK
ncbi:lipopolysaccharide biosynthesis protein [Spirochaetia bacterium 38H-sp]|uniref:Lipopolysaccharide biosynthesis protein n=1 Tax=Rarispira pelagica TaxID=3141764 RepID=A0ABU9UAG3_9SPIR